MELVPALLLGIPAAYLIQVLLLVERESHEGPFRSEEKRVRFPDSDHTQQVALFDWVRRLFGAYIVDGNYWTVHPVRSQRWTCSVCLSFWTAFVFSIPYTLSSDQWWWAPAYHLTIAVSSQITYRVLNEL